MVQFRLPHMPRSTMWDTFTRSHMSVLKLCALYAVPLSVIPPAMMYYAGTTYRWAPLPELDAALLTGMGMVFFAIELMMTFVLAYIIQRLAAWEDVKPAFENAYKLAVLAPTPLWLAPLFLFIPSLTLNITVIAAALALAGVLIYNNAPTILEVKDKRHATLLSGSVLAAGLAAFAVMVYLMLLFWGFTLSF